MSADACYVPQGREIFPYLTVYENLLMGFEARRDKRPDTAALQEMYDLFPVLEQMRTRTAGTLSGGQQQQLAIARALVAHPSVLLLDEPSLGLAPSMVDTVFETLREIRRRGIAALLVEQRAQRTVAFAERTYVISNGEVRMTLSPKDADDTERLVAAYFA